MKEKKLSKVVQIHVCPKCLSSRLRKAGSFGSDMTGSIGYLPWKYECLDCGWTGRLVIKKKMSEFKSNNKGN